MGFWRWVADPKVGRHLLRDEDEVVVDEVLKHWVAFVRPVAEGLAGVALMLVVPFVHLNIAWLFLLLATVLLLRALWGVVRERRDRFVITNMRVFRVHGVLNTHLATMPLSRILDISVRKPLIGRLLGYGHFVFESAAQDQGLHDIRFVGRPDERDLTIQRVVQRSGLRGPRVPQ
jgi:uncharacterized membrane protein YdbT with pleckstrin-like domain